MLVVDLEKSEYGRQRRRSMSGRLIHCCCICGTTDVWSRNWSVWCSIKELDDEAPVSKFCSAACRDKGGPNARNITEEMKRKAKDAEWREPKIVYREANEREKYRAAISAQQKQKPR